jgi:uncharacterized membrane protein
MQYAGALVVSIAVTWMLVRVIEGTPRLNDLFTLPKHD